MQDSPDTKVIKFLDSNQISFQRCDHPAVFTSDEAKRLVPKLPGARTKNLFLRDRKGKRHFLLVIRPDQTVDLRTLSQSIGSTRVSLASPERLQRILGVTPGAVSLLALIHDEQGQVEVVFDESVWNATHLTCHPMVNTATLVLSHDAIGKFLRLSGHSPTVIPVPAAP